MHNIDIEIEGAVSVCTPQVLLLLCFWSMPIDAALAFDGGREEPGYVGEKLSQWHKNTHAMGG